MFLSLPVKYNLSSKFLGETKKVNISCDFGLFQSKTSSESLMRSKLKSKTNHDILSYNICGPLLNPYLVVSRSRKSQNSSEVQLANRNQCERTATICLGKILLSCEVEGNICNLSSIQKVVNFIIPVSDVWNEVWGEIITRNKKLREYTWKFMNELAFARNFVQLSCALS